MSINKQIVDIANSSLSEIGKVEHLRDLINEENYKEVPFDTSDEIHIVATLFKLELLLSSNEIIPDSIDDVFSSVVAAVPFVKNKGINSEEYLKAFIKVKYHDIYGDYQLITGLYYDSIIDCVNKKVLLANSIQSNFDQLLNQINLKSLELLIISGYDFRKDIVLDFLDKSVDWNGVNDVTKRIYELITNKRLVSIELFDSFLKNIQFAVFIRRLNYDDLVKNVLENNIFNLSKYYKAINISKVSFLLNADRKIEDLIIEMIISNKLPPNSKIDQAQNLLLFGDTRINNDLNSLNNHVKEVGEIIDQVLQLVSDA
ncbi:uncharacterized protein PRCAT00003739001 [Priceomyces carsonii]|uniref:uncharacterized protein n=1 Tax=Priceomyces carsonii TaxID=28549 RepID=UPI002ED7C804|nr:unnamed protein product [Priceomyces carsonii]